MVSGHSSSRRAHSSDALGPLIGHTRAALLGDLALARTTTELADLHALGPGTVSRHLSVLHGVRLVSRNRQGRRVLYAQTALARALLAAR